MILPSAGMLSSAAGCTAGSGSRFPASDILPGIVSDVIPGSMPEAVPGILSEDLSEAVPGCDRCRMSSGLSAIAAGLPSAGLPDVMPIIN